MTAHPSRPSFAARPTEAEAWIRTPELSAGRGATDSFTARLTVDVTPALRGRIKVEAFRRDLTMAELLRTLLEREFPEDGKAAP